MNSREKVEIISRIHSYILKNNTHTSVVEFVEDVFERMKSTVLQRFSEFDSLYITQTFSADFMINGSLKRFIYRIGGKHLRYCANLIQYYDSYKDFILNKIITAVDDIPKNFQVVRIVKINSMIFRIHDIVQAIDLDNGYVTDSV